MHIKIYTIVVLLFAQLCCGAQTFSARDLYGRWHGERLGVNAYYDFVSDSTYRYWTSNVLDSTRIYQIRDLDTNHFHVIDENHFFVLATFYATEKIIFTRERPRNQIKLNLDTPRKGYKLDSVSVYFDFHLDNFLLCIAKELFQTHTNKLAIPAFIGEELDFLTGGFSLGNPDEEFQCCCTSSRKLPARLLQFLAISKNVLVMTYLTGGIAEEDHILLIKFKDRSIVDVWYGLADESLHSLPQIVKYISKRRRHSVGLHPNMYL